MPDKITIYNDEGEEIELPSKWEVCPDCHGNGVHVNRAIDGFSVDDECWQDEDFRVMYLCGGYDVQCETCDGLRVVPVLDESRCTPEQIAAYERDLQEEADYRQMQRMERMMGA